jgi:hypothetical protein
VGKVSPLVLNPVPLTLAEEIVTLVRPAFVSVSEIFLLLPSCTLLKLNAGELALNVERYHQNCGRLCAAAVE